MDISALAIARLGEGLPSAIGFVRPAPLGRTGHTLRTNYLGAEAYGSGGNVIGGFTVRLKPEAEPQRVRAITMVAVDGEHATGVVKALRSLPEVHALHTTNGRWDIVVELGVDSLEAFDQALQRIQLIKGISNSETSLLLSTHKI